MIILLSILLVLGILVTGWLAVSARPAHFLRWETLGTTGMVYVVFLWYARGLTLLVLHDGQVRFDGPPDKVASLGFLLLIDLIMTARLLSWLRFREAFRAEEQRQRREREEFPLP